MYSWTNIFIHKMTLIYTKCVKPKNMNHITCEFSIRLIVMYLWNLYDWTVKLFLFFLLYTSSWTSWFSNYFSNSYCFYLISLKGWAIFMHNKAVVYRNSRMLNKLKSLECIEVIRILEVELQILFHFCNKG